MTSSSVPPETERVNKKRFIRSKIFRERLGGISRTTEWRLEKNDPDFPIPHPRFGYDEDEADEYIAKKLAERPGRAA